jgi:hypothetical protein
MISEVALQVQDVYNYIYRTYVVFEMKNLANL